MGDYGITASQQGFSVLNCPDNKVLFSTKFRTLKILQEGWGSYQVPEGIPGAGQYAEFVEIKHNLGFYPMVLAYNYDENGEYWLTFCGIYTDRIQIDRYSFGHDYLANVTRYHYFIFDVNLEEEFFDVGGDPYFLPSPIIGKRDYGIKVASRGHSVLNTPNNYKSLISSGQSFALQRNGKAITNGAGADLHIAHSLPYAPEAYVYMKRQNQIGEWRYDILISSLTEAERLQQEPSMALCAYTVDNEALNIKGYSVAGLNFAYVILKDSVKM